MNFASLVGTLIGITWQTTTKPNNNIFDKPGKFEAMELTNFTLVNVYFIYSAQNYVVTPLC